jgi:hypothetical protein
MAGQNIQADWPLFPAANRTATNEQSQSVARSHLWRGVVVTLDITASGGTSPTLDVKLQGLSAATGVWADIPGAAFAQQTGAATIALTVYPGIGETANVAVNDVIPGAVRVDSTIGGTSGPNFTYSVGLSFVP